MTTKSTLGKNEEPGRSLGHILLLRTAGFLMGLPFSFWVGMSVAVHRDCDWMAAIPPAKPPLKAKFSLVRFRIGRRPFPGDS